MSYRLADCSCGFQTLSTELTAAKYATANSPDFRYRTYRYRHQRFFEVRWVSDHRIRTHTSLEETTRYDDCILKLQTNLQRG